MQPVFSVSRKLEGGLLGLLLLYSLIMGSCMPVAVEPTRILERAPIVAGLLGYMASGAYRCANFFAVLDSYGSALSSAFLAATVAVSLLLAADAFVLGQALQVIFHSDESLLACLGIIVFSAGLGCFSSESCCFGFSFMFDHGLMRKCLRRNNLPVAFLDRAVQCLKCI
ncbi:MAG: uncharacterized protein KVP18_000293 [Porospora cf. gigantea A]|uniref:uncharacterized protein n=2 Tax=Porospora cf. gigantea A TaxID=2853593 RepID=UPI003559C2D0|nr:MAG: hypothetical protein KVP18_000293 [Porospora cf. gigantea A]